MIKDILLPQVSKILHRTFLFNLLLHWKTSVLFEYSHVFSLKHLVSHKKKKLFNSTLHFFWHGKSNFETTLLKFCELRANNLAKKSEQRNDLALSRYRVGKVSHLLKTKPSKLNFETICRNPSAAVFQHFFVTSFSFEKKREGTYDINGVHYPSARIPLFTNS